MCNMRLCVNGEIASLFIGCESNVMILPCVKRDEWLTPRIVFFLIYIFENGGISFFSLL